MRLGLALRRADDGATVERLAAEARLAEQVGFELLWIEPGDGCAPLIAAALAEATRTVRLAIVVPVDLHPIEIAERVAVADNVCGGRIVLVLDGGAHPAALADETVEVVQRALSGAAFDHAGERWTLPACLEVNTGAARRITVTPPPVQLDLPVWLRGATVAALARERHLPFVADAAPEGAGEPRSLIEVPCGIGDAVDADGLTARLDRAQRDDGLELAVLTLAPERSDEQRADAIVEIATRVRPRIMLDRLPAGLERHWSERLGSDRRRLAVWPQPS